jgi:hypothetical protein
LLRMERRRSYCGGEHNEGGWYMLKVCLVALSAMLVGGSALAQPATGYGSARQTGGSVQRPVDHGPFTPEANSAFQGGGMILQGAPGAPAPTPEPTPPGQTPRNMVPPR